jgi:hypothetical protein
MAKLRDLFGTIIKSFSKSAAVAGEGSVPRERSLMRLERDVELTAWFKQHECCPDCGSNEFIGGPRGGLAQNMTCSGCGSEYNIARYDGAIFMVDRIDRCPVPPGNVVITTRHKEDPPVVH